MKVVKLNRRFRQFRDYGHTMALRFEHGHTKDASEIVKVCRARLNGQGWLREHDWYAYYGETPRPDPNRGLRPCRPYWITFRRESDLTLVLLSVNLTQNT
jgi:hypothetical protein